MKQNYFKPSILFVFTAASCLFLLPMTSPIFSLIGDDSAIFLLIGRLLPQGGVFYTDLFDHKGPLIFFINGFPQIFINGTLGVWLIEVVFLLASLYLIYKTALLLISEELAIFPAISYLFYFILTISNGNFTEEYANFFSIIAIYLFVKRIEILKHSDKTLHINRFAFLLGVLFALIFFTRVNNLTTLATIVIMMLVYLMPKNLMSALKFILFGIVGILTVTLPIIIYFYLNGALYDMFYASILYNFMYSENLTSTNFVFLTNPFFLLAIIVCLLAFIFCLKNKEFFYGGFIAVNTLISTVAVNLSGYPFRHYLLLLAPVFMFSMIMLIKFSHKNIVAFVSKYSTSFFALCILLLIAVQVANIVLSDGLYDVYLEKENYDAQVLETMDYIPEDQWDEIYGYNIDAKWFYTANVIPCFKYFTLQDWQGENDKKIFEEINHFFDTSPPKWLLIPSGEDTVKYQDILLEISENYVEVYKNELSILYQRK